MNPKKNKIGFATASKIESDKLEKDIDADKSGTDTNSDTTKSVSNTSKFDKPKREIDPDKTGIDVDSDKTKPDNKQK